MWLFNANLQGSSAAVTTEYQAVLDRGTTEGFTLPSAGEQIKGNQLMIDLLANGSFALMTTLQVYSGSNSDFSRIDWIDPTNVYVAVNSPTYNTVTGFKFDGATNYLRSNNFKMTQDLTEANNYGGGWNAANYAYDGTYRALMGLQESTAQSFSQYVRFEGVSLNTTVILGAANAGLTNPNELQDGVNYMYTNVGSLYSLYEDGVVSAYSGSGTRTTALINLREWYVGGAALNGVIAYHSTTSVKYMFLGVSMEGLEASTNTAFENYLL